MNINNHIYALLIGVGNYVELNIPNLPSYRMDLVLIATALINGLKCNQENIRIMAGEDSNGIVNADDFVREIGRFGKNLSEQDTFLFYFSGHGSAKTLAFSNLQLNQQSVIDYIDKIPCKNKIVFLDCCYSGNFKSLEAKHVDIEKSINEFVGHGIAVYASSSADELSRIAIEGNHSVFTGALATALISKNIVHKGKIELNDIYKETNRLVMAWNRKYPDKKQNPIYRSSIGGTIYFQVEDYKEYVPQNYTLHNEIYDVVKTKPLNSSNEKRLCVFVVLHERATDELLIKITKEVVAWLKDADVYSSKSGEEKFRNISVSAMNYEIFKEVVKEKFMDYMPEKFKGMELVAEPVEKVNVTLDGIILREEGRNISPTIYINDMYKKYKDCGDLEETLMAACDFMERAYEQAPVVDVDSIMRDANEKIVFQLINTEQNKTFLEAENFLI